MNYGMTWVFNMLNIKVTAKFNKDVNKPVLPITQLRLIIHEFEQNYSLS